MDKMPKAPPTNFYVSFVQRRGYSGGNYKLHLNLGHAKNAVSYQDRGTGVRGGQIWEWSALRLEWVLLFDVKPGTKRDDLTWERVSGNLDG